MIVKTYEPVIPHRDEITQKIARFWDQISEGWRKVWGQHIHHGYYENDAALTPQEAQEKLIEKLADLLELKPGCRILDVGCGMGGSSLYLAKKYQANVTGITLSKKQITIAEQQATKVNATNVSFKIEDALSLASFLDNSFDIIWSLESCEQFFDKNLFIQQAYRVLKPGGKLMLATWCSNQNEYAGTLAKKYQQLCYAFDLPYMPTIEHYRGLLKKQKFSVHNVFDWTPFVEKSWDVGISLVNAYNFLQLLRMSGWRGFRFAKQTKMMQEAFHQGRVKYGVFLAVKPA